MNTRNDDRVLSQPELKALAAIDTLVAEGTSPTYQNVRARCGGSYTTISQALSHWRATQAAKREMANVSLPPDILEAGRAHAALVWQRAEQVSATRFEASLREQAALAESAAKREQEALAVADRSAEEAAMATTALEMARRDLAELRQQTAAQIEELVSLRRDAAKALEVERQLRGQLLEETRRAATAEGRIAELVMTKEAARKLPRDARQSSLQGIDQMPG